ncbi:MAG: DegT/DnrJ/EryC1/StrS family aminotransferase [Promicromonosporaceae bacterium]|nr:DegT/DnrJ/EryC1/StrS family aminotransferase [Promicromonosporaceae bacterium]
MLPYGRQSINDDDVAAVVEALRGDWLTIGPTVDRFEAALAALGGVPHAVSVTSGTAALHVAYHAAGIQPGDEVITTPLTFMATAAGAALLGAKIVFADVDPATGNLDPAAVAPLLTERTKVIAAVDYAGVPVDAPALRRLARDNGALFLQDAAHSVGGALDGQPVGSLADLTTYSFFPTKNLTTTEGGAVLTANPDLAARARRFHNQGFILPGETPRLDEGPWLREIVEFSLNYRLPDVWCALGLSQLRRLPEFVARRAALKARYDEALADLVDSHELVLPGTTDNASPAWHLYPLRVPAERRRAVFESLRSQGIGVQVNYLPVYWHPVFADLGYPRGLCPQAEAYYRCEISLPMWPGLTEANVAQVVDALRVALSV